MQLRPVLGSDLLSWVELRRGHKLTLLQTANVSDATLAAHAGGTWNQLRQVATATVVPWRLIYPGLIIFGIAGTAWAAALLSAGPRLHNALTILRAYQQRRSRRSLRR